MEKNRVYGGRCGELLATYDHESSSWKTLQISFDWAEPMLLEVLPKSGMTVNGQLFPLNNLALPMFESDGFVLPTPTASDIKRVKISPSDLRAEERGFGVSLPAALFLKVFPTPTARTPGNCPSYPSVWRRHKIHNIGHLLGVHLCQAMEITQEEAIGRGARVNPSFVEWMMGFPTGWTETPKESTTNDSKR